MANGTYTYSKDDFLKYLKEEDPDFKSSWVQSLSDDEIYSLGVEKFGKYKNEIEPYYSQEQQEQISQISKKREEADISPGWVESFYRLGVNEDSAEWRKAAYESSIAGMTEKVVYGELEWDPKDYDLNWLEEIGAGVHSFLFPLDAATMWVPGGLAAKGWQKAGAKITAGKIAKSEFAEMGIKGKLAAGLADRGLDTKLSRSIAERIIGTSSQLVPYEATKGGLLAKLNDEDVFLGAAKGGAHGMALSVALGGAGGAMGHHYREAIFAKQFKKGNYGAYGLSDKLTKVQKESWNQLSKTNSKIDWSEKSLDKLLRATGPGAQYFVDASLFTAAGEIDRVMHGEEKFNWENLIKNFVVNAGFIGTMKAGHKLVGKIGEDARNLKTWTETELAKRKAAQDAEGKARKNVDKTMDNFSKAESETSKTKHEKAKDEFAEQRATEEKDLRDSGIALGEIAKEADFIRKRMETATEKSLSQEIGLVGEMQNKLNEARGILEKYDVTVTGQKLETTVKDINKLEKQLSEQLQLRKDAGAETKAQTRQRHLNELDALNIKTIRNKQGKAIPIEKAKPEELRDARDAQIKIQAEKEGISQSQMEKSLSKVVSPLIGDKPGAQKMANTLIKSLKKQKEAGALKKPSPSKTAYERYVEFDKKISKDDNLALTSYASEGGLNKTYSKTIGQFLTWLKKTKNGKPWSKTNKDDMYEYIHEVVLKREKKNKPTGADISPFSKFGKWAEYAGWTPKNKAAGISFDEANKWRFIPVEQRQIKKDIIQKTEVNRESVVKKSKQWEGAKENEVNLITQLTSRGIRPEEINKIRPKDFKKSEDGRYYIDMTVPKKKGSGPRLAIKVTEDMYNIAQALGKEQGMAKPFTGKKLIPSPTEKGKKKSLLKAIAEELFQDPKANLKDTRNALEMIKEGVPEAKLTQQELNAYLGHVAGSQKGAVDIIYKMVNKPLKDQLNISEKVEAALGIGGAKIKKFKTPTPHEPPQKKFIKKILESKGEHIKASKNPAVYKKLKGGKQEQIRIAESKEIVESALEGNYLVKSSAIDLLSKYIDSHKVELKKPNLSKESIKHNKNWIKDYSQMIDFLKGVKEKTVRSYDVDTSIRHDIKKLNRWARAVQKEAGRYDKNSAKRKAMEVEDIRNLFPHFNNKNKRIKHLNEKELVEYINRMSEAKEISTKNKSKFPILEAKAKKFIEERKDIDFEQVESILKNLDVKDGLWENINHKDVYKLLTHKVEFLSKPLPKEQTVSTLDKSDSNLNRLRRRDVIFYDAAELLAKKGGRLGKKISDAILNADVLNASYKGWVAQTMKDVTKLHREAGFKSKEDYMMMFKDKEMQRDLSAREKQYIKLMNTKGSPIERATKLVDNMYKDYYDQIPAIVRDSNWASKISTKKIEDFLDRSRVENYYTRRVNSKVIESIASAKGPVFEMLLKKNLKMIADKEVAKLKEKGASDSKIEAKRESIMKGNTNKDAERINKLKGELVDYFSPRGTTLLKLDFLHARTFTLPRTVEIVGASGKLKKVKAYEESLDGTVGYYGVAMSRYLSNLKYLPEFTRLGKEFGRTRLKNNLLDILEKPGNARQKGFDLDWAQYMTGVLRSHLGLENPATTAASLRDARILGKVSSTFALTGLSSFTSGFKNLAIGIPRSIGHFGLFNTTKAMVHFATGHESLKRRNLDWVKEYGSKQLVLEAQEQYLQQIPVIGKYLTSDTVFKLNLMTQTEGMNRIVSSYAGDMMFKTMLHSYHGGANKEWYRAGGKPIGGKKEIERAYKDIWRLSKEERAFLTDKNKTIEDFINPKTEADAKRMDWINTKVQHFSHVSTQGSTSAALLPKWMSNKWAKPLTLFQRMAWSTTSDIARNYIKPLRNGNVMPLMRAMAGHYLSGVALYEFYKFYLGQEVPEEYNENIIMRNLPYLWRSEFFGLFGELFNPHTSFVYGSRRNPLTSFFGDDAVITKGLLEPVIIRNSRILFENVPEMAAGLFGKEKKFFHQAVRDIMTNTVVVLGQFDRVAKNWESSDYLTHKNLKKVGREFMKQQKWEMSGDFKATHKTPYFRDLKESFWFGDKDEWARSYWNAYNYISTELEREYTSPSVRHKKTISAIKKSLKAMNPVNFSEDVKGRPRSRKTEFYNYLKKNDKAKFKEAKKLEKEYHYRLRQMFGEVEKSKYRKKYSIYAGKDFTPYKPSIFGTF